MKTESNWIINLIKENPSIDYLEIEKRYIRKFRGDSSKFGKVFRKVFSEIKDEERNSSNTY